MSGAAPRIAVAEECAIDWACLGWLLRAGRVAGSKRGGRWYTAAAAVQRYQQEVAGGAIPTRRPRRGAAKTPT